ncbi:hypothetical protein OOT09_17625 [Streptomyces sp. NBC_00199]|nr:hypothetical protein [Streptomyces sp. NBC_00199]
MLLAVLVGVTDYAHTQERRGLALSAALPPETGEYDRATERAE